jgi:UV DNA damage endonuclease
MLRLGYACINEELRTQDIFCSRTVRIETVVKQGVEILPALALKNLDDLLTILQWNEKHDIRFFRITSNLFPHMGNPALLKLFPDNKYLLGSMGFANKILSKIGQFVRKHKHRVTFHAHPYAQLGTPHIAVLLQTIADLKSYHKTFVKMGLEPGSFHCVIVHGGGVYKDREATLKRIAANIEEYLLPTGLHKMLVFENDENGYSPLDLLPLCEKFNLGFCLDFFHNEVSVSPIELDNALLERIVTTWGTVVPKVHISEQKVGGKRGAHSDYVKRIPAGVFKMRELCKDRNLDVMIECKAKEKSILKLLQLTV